MLRAVIVEHGINWLPVFKHTLYLTCNKLEAFGFFAAKFADY